MLYEVKGNTKSLFIKEKPFDTVGGLSHLQSARGDSIVKILNTLNYSEYHRTN